MQDRRHNEKQKRARQKKKPKRQEKLMKYRCATKKVQQNLNRQEKKQTDIKGERKKLRKSRNNSKTKIYSEDENKQDARNQAISFFFIFESFICLLAC